MKAINLKTEYLARPMGIDMVNPRFYWNCEGGIKQTAYRITAFRDGETLWDSGKVESSAMSHIRYEGQPLKSRDRVDWAVQLWDENGTAGEAVTSWFELGLLEKSDWEARWISGAYKPKKNRRYPVDYFKKEFAALKPVKKARLYITACGLYEASINGRRVGEFRLAPGCTDYRRRLQYQTYDVGALLSDKNTLEIKLADGWYRGSIGAFGAVNVYGRQTKLLCQLEIEYEGSRNTVIVSDDSFAWCADGPIRFADLKDGEIYDASMVPSYSGTAVLAKEAIIPTASNNVEPKEHEVFDAALIHTPKGTAVLDFGQNLAGIVSFSVQGKKGQKIKLRLGEILDENGEFTQSNIQVKKMVKEGNKITEMIVVSGGIDKLKGEKQFTPLQEVVFYCSGSGVDQYKTTFAVFGFRYALVESDSDMIITPSAFRAIAVYSGMEPSGSFECSNADVNRFFQNALWSMKGNFLDVPTDCPTRERMAWTGDGQIFFNTAAYLMNVAPFFQKWLYDLQDGQLKNGRVPAVVPYGGVKLMYDLTGVSAGWADALVLIPYRYWKRYGDVAIIENFYSMMRKFALFLIKHTGHKDRKTAKVNPYNKYVYEKGVQLGEWLEPVEFQEIPSFKKKILQTEVCTAYLHYTMSLMAEIARALCKQDDETLFAEYAEGAKKAYHHLFLKNETIDTDRQAKLVRPLVLGLLDGKSKRNVQKRLVKAVENRAYNINTGFLSTPFILPALTEAGRADIAYKMLENTNAPSWLAEVKAGATTVWEDWEGKVSRNHYSPGAVCEWLFNTAAGITVDGENHFHIAPVPGGSFSFAEAKYTSLYGTVHSRWKITDDGFCFDVTIPPNTTAEIQLPRGERGSFDAGTYSFNISESCSPTEMAGSV